MKKFVARLGLRPDLLVADVRKVVGQLEADGFGDPLGTICLILFVGGYMIIPTLMLTGVLY